MLTRDGVTISDSAELETKWSHLGSHCHGKVVEDGFDSAKGLVISKRRGAERRMTTEELVNVSQEYINVEDGEDGCELSGNAPQALSGRRGGRFTAHTNTQIQPELTFMAISDRLVAEPSEFKLSNITCSSDLQKHNHHYHSNDSFTTLIATN